METKERPACSPGLKGRNLAVDLEKIGVLNDRVRVLFVLKTIEFDEPLVIQNHLP